MTAGAERKTDAELADRIGAGRERWRHKVGRELSEAEELAVATLALGIDAPEPVQKAAKPGAVKTRLFRPADERRHVATLDAAPRSPQAERVRAAADERIQEEHRARR